MPFPTSLDTITDGVTTIQAAHIKTLQNMLVGPLIHNIVAFGAKGDCRWFSDASITSGTAILSSPALAQFTQADVGKTVEINGAAPPGTNGTVLSTTVLSVQSLTSCTLATNATQTASGTAAKIGTQNNPAVQAAINQQQTYGGRVRIPLDPYGGKYLCSPGLTAAPGAVGSFTTSTRPLLIEGDGMLNSTIVSGAPNTFSGLFGNGSASVIEGQIIMSDLTLDGDYTGVAGGAMPQPASLSGALVCLTWPYTNDFAPPSPLAPTGEYHVFTRVRFYRPPGFVFQPAQGAMLDDCLFDQVGQPDVASGGLHYDNIGSGCGDVIAIGCSWKDSSGNYADFTNVGTNTVSRLIMLGCVSRNHQIGGVYAAGVGSIIAFNRLSNNVAGSGIGYDASGPTANRSKNMVFGNVLTNISVNTSLLSNASYGDVVFGNIASDSVSGATFGQGVIDLGQIAGNVNNPAIPIAGAQHGDKLLLQPGSGSGARMGFGTLAGALITVLPNAAGQRFSIRLDPGSTTAMSGGTEIFAFTSGNHLIISNASAPAATNKGANVTSATATGNDTIGTIVVVMAGALAANTRIATFTFNVSYGAASPIINLTNQTSGVGLAIVNPYATFSTGVSFDLFCNQALATGTYTFGYHVIGITAGGA